MTQNETFPKLGPILLTGATGYLGSQVARALIQSGYEVIVLKRESSNMGRLEDLLPGISGIFNIEDGLTKVFQTRSISGVIHCATNYGRKHKDSLQIIEANLILPLTLLEEGTKAGLKFFINTDTLLDKRLNDYSLSKRQFNDWLKVYKSKLICVNLALEHFYGAGDDPSKFVSWIVTSILNKVPRILLTPGEQKRDFLYVDDVIGAFLLVMKNIPNFKSGYHSYEVGSGFSISIKDLVTKISDFCQPHNTQIEFGAIPYRENEVMNSTANLQPLLELGWRPTTTLEEGLQKTIRGEK